MEVEVAGIDSEALGELAVRQRRFLALAKHLEHAQAQRMAEGFQLLRTIDGEDVEQRRLRLG